MSFGASTNTTFLGLATTTAIFAGIGGVCLIGFETMRQIKRLPNVQFASLSQPWAAFRRAEVQPTSNGSGHPNGDHRPQQKTSNDQQKKELLTCEDWEMGHLYHARTFHATTPTPALARWPLQWAWQAIKFDDWFYATHTGMDTVIYVRFLKAAVLWTLLQTLTTAPALLAIHFHYSEHFVETNSIEESNMARASLSYVAASPSIECASTDKDLRSKCVYSPNPDGQKILWVHLLLLYYMTFTWWYALWRIAHGGLKIRWRLIQRTRETEAKKVKEHRIHQDTQQADSQNRSRRQRTEDSPLDSLGWRQRTLMISNLPATMRSEAGIRRYFEEYLRPDDASTIADERESMLHDRTSSHGNGDVHAQNNGNQKFSDAPESDLHRFGSLRRSDTKNTADNLVSPVKTMVGEEDDKNATLSKGREPMGPEPDLQPDRHLRSPIQAVVLVRKMDELSSLLTRRQAVLGQLEAAHVKLAGAVLADVRTRMDKHARAPGAQNPVAPEPEPVSLRARINLLKKGTSRKDRAQRKSDVEARDGNQLSEHNLRVEELVKHLGPFVKALDEQQARAGVFRGKEGEETKFDESVWEALAEVPRELLDPYQPVTRLSALFRGQTVPTIDYLLTKLNLLTALVTEMRSRPPSTYAPASTAFVTFRDPRQARMVWRELKDQIVAKVRLAPEVKDLDWERLMSTTFSGEVGRGAGVSVFVWGMTIFWTILINLLTTGLANFTNVGGLKPFFAENEKLSGFVSTTLPSLAVSLITMAVPELVFQVSKRAQGFVTFSQLYDMCLTRYWKFVILNIVVFFTIGSATLRTIIATFSGSGKDTSSQNLLATIGYSFPTSAPYFVSYLILGMGLHSGFELLGFMVPLIQHYGARRAKTPRVRAIKTLPRNFNRYYWLPFHVLILTILFIFTLLNPLVMPFGLVYLLFAYVVFKKNLAFIYYRRFNEKEGVVYFVRIMRFSLDGLIVGQAVLLILFAVLKLRAVYIGFCALTIPLTVIFKLLGTRWWRSQCRALDEEEACALCGLDTLRSVAESNHTADRSYGGDMSFRGSFDGQIPPDARASGRYPPIIIPQETTSVFYNTWQRIHDSFHANGFDRPSHIAQMGSRGEKLDNPALASAKALVHAPAAAARVSANAAKHRAGIAKATLGLGKGRERRAMQKAADEIAARVGGDDSLATEPTAEDRTQISRAKSFHSRAASCRSEEAPFLSGFDVVSSHAPVPTTHGEDDDECTHEGIIRTHSTPRRNRSNRGTPRKQTRQGLHPLDTSMGGIDRLVIGAAGSTTSRDNSAQEGQQGLRDPDLSEFGTIGPMTPRKAAAAKEAPPPLVEDAVTDDGDEDNSSDWDDDEDEDDLPLVRRHAPPTWDDTPNNSAKYNNPFYNHHLDPFLWLPRDPTQILNLFDTIEWYGPALVSSQGGAGNVGEWEDEEEETMDEKGSVSEMGGVPKIISGHEEIVLSDTLARHLEQAEEVEEAQDPAASLPKAVMKDYRDAIRQNTRSEAGGSVAGSVSDTRLGRQDSFTSGFSSVRSPTQAFRQRMDQSQSLSVIGTGPSRQFSGGTRDLTDESIERTAAGTRFGVEEHPGDTPLLRITDATLTGEPDETLRTAPEGGISPTSPASPERVLDQGTSVSSHAVAPTHASHTIAFAGSTKTYDHDPYLRVGTHPRRSAGASNMSHATAASAISSTGGTGARPVTLREALRAEILEEEWRTTLKERLTTLKRSKMVSKLGSKGRRRSGRGGDGEIAGGEGPSIPAVAEEREGSDAQAAMAHLESSTSGIMARHALRRQLARSEGGDHTVEELLHAARSQGTDRFGGGGGGGHSRGFSLVGRSRSRASRREASSTTTTGIAAATLAAAMPTAGNYRAGAGAGSSAEAGPSEQRRPVTNSASAPTVEHVPMREFGVRAVPRPSMTADP
ncbi:hypothetical protein CF319_g4016 [Tilletia indica]|nr:hypothetical protein CF319_g4016 [Tilletia indica]